VCASTKEVDHVDGALEYLALDVQATGAVVFLAKVQALLLSPHDNARRFEGVADFTIHCRHDLPTARILADSEHSMTATTALTISPTI
jgi:hypothetical protein